MITSKDNSLVKYIKSLSQKKYRDINKEYIIEGYKILQEAIENEENIFKIILCEELISKKDVERIEWTEDLKKKTEYVSETIFKTLSDTMSPQGILAVVKQKEVTNPKYDNVIFALDDLQDPGNLGTIIRTLDAAGYRDLILSQGTTEAYNPKVVRSTMGAIFRLKIHSNCNLKEKLQELKNQGYKIVTTSLETDKYYYDLDFNDKLVIIIGNEAKGVSKEIQEMSDKKIKIPMLGKTESLNAAVATSILAYEGVRQKVASKNSI